MYPDIHKTATSVWRPIRRSACHIPTHRRCFSDAYVTLRDCASVHRPAGMSTCPRETGVGVPAGGAARGDRGGRDDRVGRVFGDELEASRCLVVGAEADPPERRAGHPGGRGRLRHAGQRQRGKEQEPAMMMMRFMWCNSLILRRGRMGRCGGWLRSGRLGWPGRPRTAGCGRPGGRPGAYRRSGHPAAAFRQFWPGRIR